MRLWWLRLFFFISFCTENVFSLPPVVVENTKLAPLNIKALLLPAIAAGVVLGQRG